MITINPATDKVVKEYKEHTPAEVEYIINSVDEAFHSWRSTAFSHRRAIMRKAAEILRVRKEEYATLITMETGKPITESRGEVEKSAWVCDYYADKAETFL